MAEFLKKIPILGGLTGDGVTTSGFTVLAAAWGAVLTIEGVPPWLKATLIIASACIWNIAGALKRKETP